MLGVCDFQQHVNIPTRQHNILDPLDSIRFFHFYVLCIDPTSSINHCVILSHFKFAPSTLTYTKAFLPDFSRTNRKTFASCIHSHDWPTIFLFHDRNQYRSLPLSTLSFIVYTHTLSWFLKSTRLYLPPSIIVKKSRISAILACVLCLTYLLSWTLKMRNIWISFL